MGQAVMMIGGLSVLFGAFDIMSYGDSVKENGWKKPATKILGGLALVGVGALMKLFGV
jgi:hypothetical protein